MHGSIDSVVSVKLAVIHSGHDDKANRFVRLSARQGFEGGGRPIDETLFIRTNPSFTMVLGSWFELRKFDACDMIVLCCRRYNLWVIITSSPGCNRFLIQVPLTTPSYPFLWGQWGH